MSGESDFEIQVRNGKGWGGHNSPVTTTVAVAIRLPGSGTVLELHRGTQVNVHKIEGIAIGAAQMPYTDAGSEATVAWASGVPSALVTVTIPSFPAVVTRDGSMRVTVKAPTTSTMFGNACGRCGNFDGSVESNDMTREHSWWKTSAAPPRPVPWAGKLRS